MPLQNILLGADLTIIFRNVENVNYVLCLSGILQYLRVRCSCSSQRRILEYSIVLACSWCIHNFIYDRIFNTMYILWYETETSMKIVTVSMTGSSCTLNCAVNLSVRSEMCNQLDSAVWMMQSTCFCTVQTAVNCTLNSAVSLSVHFDQFSQLQHWNVQSNPSFCQPSDSEFRFLYTYDRLRVIFRIIVRKSGLLFFS